MKPSGAVSQSGRKTAETAPPCSGIGGQRAVLHPQLEVSGKLTLCSLWIPSSNFIVFWTTFLTTVHETLLLAAVL
ncbi:hypothetical protein AMECASPLE_013395 [Ameca splendens]|uniref:Uncharacterized protein n=1 Tax=Ameca splendens TaxID=208324 RepID=A0ABV0ZL43_9TELE